MRQIGYPSVIVRVKLMPALVLPASGVLSGPPSAELLPG
jgi:hypothetical protein